MAFAPRTMPPSSPIAQDNPGEDVDMLAASLQAPVGINCWAGDDRDGNPAKSVGELNFGPGRRASVDKSQLLTRSAYINK